jgi:uncharacterized membrane protein
MVDVMVVLSEDEGNDGIAVSSRLLGLVLLGITLIFVGLVVIIVASVVLGGGSGSVGGIILIGPIPIVFGAGPEAGWLIAVSIIISVISIVSFLIMNRRVRRIEN